MRLIQIGNSRNSTSCSYYKHLPRKAFKVNLLLIFLLSFNPVIIAKQNLSDNPDSLDPVSQGPG